MTSGIWIAHFHGLGKNLNRVEKQLLLLVEKLGAFNSRRHTSRQGVGQVKVFRREGFLPVAPVQVQDAQTLSRRAQEDTKNRCHGAFMDALSSGQLRIVSNATTKDRLALGKGAIGHALTEGMASLGLTASGGQGPQAQLATGTVGQDDGASLRVQGADSVVQNGMQQIFPDFDVAQVMAGAKQS